MHNHEASHYIPAHSHPIAGSLVEAPPSAEEIQARLARNALFLSDENQRVWCALLEQEWFEQIRALAKHPSILSWLQSAERIAAGNASSMDVKQAVFYRSAFRQAQLPLNTESAAYNQVGDGLMLLSRYLTTRLRPQHSHFEN